jgi:hypothetical protein
MSEVAVVPSDIFPVVRRFLLESGLQRTLKAFQKETEVGVDEVTPVPKKRRGLLKRLESLELTAACELWLQRHECKEEEGEEEPPKKKKKLAAGVQVEVVAEVEEQPKKKKKAALEQESQPVEVTAVTDKNCNHDAVASPVLAAKKKKHKEDKAQKPAGVPFSRVDETKWVETVKDSRMLDNTHKAKAKFGASEGDSWADKASEDMLKVKGKGFRKEMQKKKRASWKGCGELDQGVNSIKFAGSSDDE